MRLRIVSITCVLFGIVVLSASAIEAGVGVRMGWNFGSSRTEAGDLQATEDDAITVHRRSGFTGGLTSRIMFADLIGIQPEILFTQMGGGYKGEVDEWFGEELDEPFFVVSEDRFNVLSLPLLATAKINLGSIDFDDDGVMPLSLHPQAGVSVETILGEPVSSTELAADPDSVQGIDGDPISDDWRSTAYSYVLGLAIETPGTDDGPSVASLALRYSEQFSGFGPDDFTENNQRTLRNFSISINIMYIL
ncbi:MAG: PorT family protein [Spirochaetaceae bacterium]|nr:MAG: PorT family protein [Spirochaetaceae bacterium]